MKKIIFLIVLTLLLSSCANNIGEKTPITNSIDNTVIEQSMEPSITLDDVIEKNEVKRIGLGEFKQKLEKGDSILIDLRTSGEVSKGIISGAKQIDFYSSDFKKQLNKLDKEKKYLIYCRSGARSGKTLELMKNLGFKNVGELEGGWLNWVNSGELISTMEDTMENDMMKDDMMMKKTINISAKNWEFDKSIIKVKQGENIVLKINNTDGLHGIAIPSMKVVENETLKLDTSKKGEFEYICANYCGDGHSSMKGKIIIE